MTKKPNKTLILRLGGPMQSWGVSSKYNFRESGSSPSKSGVFGMLAAAKGIDRNQGLGPISDLKFGVRVDRPGVQMRDFQTASRETGESMPITHRYYISDAEFLVCVQGDSEIIEDLRDALYSPKFVLSLGRRSYPPTGNMVIGVSDRSLSEELEMHKWLGLRLQRKLRENRSKEAVRTPEKLRVIRDADKGEIETGRYSRQRDFPVSFSSSHRIFSERPVVEYYVETPVIDMDVPMPDFFDSV